MATSPTPRVSTTPSFSVPNPGAAAAVTAAGGLGATAGAAATGTARATSSATQIAVTTGKLAAGLLVAGAANKLLTATDQQVRDAASLSSGGRGPYTAESTNPNYRIYIVNNFANMTNPTVVKAWLPEQVSLDVSAAYSALFGQGLFGEGNAFDLGARTFGFTGLSQIMSFKIWTSSQGVTMTLPLVFTVDDFYSEADVIPRDAQSRAVSDSGQYGILDAIIELQKLCLPSNVPGQLFLEPPGSVVKFEALNSLSEFVNTAITATASLATNTANGGGAGSADQSKDQGPQAPPGSNTTTSVNPTNNGWLSLRSWTSVYIGNFMYFDKVVIENVSAGYDMQMDKNGKPMRATVNVTFSTLFDATVQDLNSIYLTGRVEDPNVKANPDAKA